VGYPVKVGYKVKKYDFNRNVVLTARFTVYHDILCHTFAVINYYKLS